MDKKQYEELKLHINKYNLKSDNNKLNEDWGNVIGWMVGICNQYELTLNLEKQRIDLERATKTKNENIAKLLFYINEHKELVERKKNLENCAEEVNKNIERLESFYEDIEIKRPIKDIITKLTNITNACTQLETIAIRNGIDTSNENISKNNFAEEITVYIERSLRDSLNETIRKKINERHSIQ